MAVTAIKRDEAYIPYIIRMITNDLLSVVAGTGYLTAQNANITAINEGPWTWLPSDTVLVYSTAQQAWSWYTVNPNFTSLVPFTVTNNGLAGLGIHTALYTNAGGSATTVISDPAIAAADVVIARFVSSANLATVETVVPTAGTITMVSNVDPGASVVEYISFVPSSALVAAGIVGGKGSYAGGSATFVIADVNILAGMTVNANFVSQANASMIQTVLAGAGTLTFVCNANPGASVIEYMAVAGSPALVAEGLDAVNYVYAGGSTSIVITDPNITATSRVTADFQSQAVASVIQKVTPGAGSLTVLASVNPGVSVIDYIAASSSSGGEFLLSPNNLSDVASASASLANLGGLALAGGQMTGSILLDRGTATSTAGAATVNHQAGVITTEALTTAAAAAYAFTLTDSRITTASIVFLQLMGGTNTTRGLELRAVPGAGSAAISIYNNNVAGTALNGTLIFGFEVI